MRRSLSVGQAWAFSTPSTTLQSPGRPLVLLKEPGPQETGLWAQSHMAVRAAGQPLNPPRERASTEQSPYLRGWPDPPLQAK